MVLVLPNYIVIFISYLIIGKQCVFVIGYAHGGEDKQIGTTFSAQGCLDLMKNIEPGANGVTWESEHQKCFAEFGAKMISSVCKTCQSCIFEGTF